MDCSVVSIGGSTITLSLSFSQEVKATLQLVIIKENIDLDFHVKYSLKVLRKIIVREVEMMMNHRCQCISPVANRLTSVTLNIFLSPSYFNSVLPQLFETVASSS